MVAQLHCSSGCLVRAVLRFIMLQLLQSYKKYKNLLRKGPACFVLRSLWICQHCWRQCDSVIPFKHVWHYVPFLTLLQEMGGAQSPCQILRYFNVLYWYLLIFLIGWAMIWWSDIWSSGYCRHVVPGRRYGIGALGTPELRWSVICVFFQQPTDWHFCVSNRVNAVPSSPGR